MSFMLYKTLMETTFAPQARESLENAINGAKRKGQSSLMFEYPIGMTSMGDFKGINFNEARSIVEGLGCRIVKIEPQQSTSMVGFADKAKLYISLLPPPTNNGGFTPVETHIPQPSRGFGEHVKFAAPPRPQHQFDGTPLFK